jgi:hypothetical protein
MDRVADDSARPLSNADSMALMGILSTQLLHELFVKRWQPEANGRPTEFQVLCDRVSESADVGRD